MKTTHSLLTCGLLALAFSGNAFAGGAQSRIDSRVKKIEKLNAANEDDRLRLTNIASMESIVSKLEGMPHDNKNQADSKCRAADEALTKIKDTQKSLKESPLDGKGSSFVKRVNKARKDVEKAWAGTKCKVIDLFVDDTPVAE
jgi:hypothetical protein